MTFKAKKVRQMTFSSCLNNRDSDLILDTSVFINLIGSGACGQILEALPNRILITAPALDELIPNPDRSRDDRAAIEKQIQLGRVQVADLESVEWERFEALVTADDRPLGDGEAATIAVAEQRGALAVIDEKRARIVAPDATFASSVDILAHNGVKAALGNFGHTQAVYNSLRQSRMSVREDQVDWVIGLIGLERASECNSLPGYKALRDQACQLRKANQIQAR